MSKLRVMLVLLALLAFAVPAAFAQEETFGLSAEDFARLGAAITQSGEAADSLGFNFTVDFAVEGEDGGSAALSGTALIGSNEAGPVAQFNLTGEADGSPVTLDAVLIDNMIYVNDGSGWQGQSADDLLESFSSMSPVPLDSIASGDVAQDPAAMEGLSEAMAALGDINPADLITMTNAGTEGDSTHFVIDVGIQEFLASPAFTQLLSASAAMSGDESAAAQVEGMGQMIGMMLQDTTLAINYYVGSDNLVNGFGIDFGLGINPAMMGGGADAQPVNISLVLDVNTFQYGADVSGIVAPEGATMAEG
jgi:hypothetical protein